MLCTARPIVSLSCQEVTHLAYILSAWKPHTTPPVFYPESLGAGSRSITLKIPKQPCPGTFHNTARTPLHKYTRLVDSITMAEPIIVGTRVAVKGYSCLGVVMYVGPHQVAGKVRPTPCQRPHPAGCFGTTPAMSSLPARCQPSVWRCCLTERKPCRVYAGYPYSREP